MNNWKKFKELDDIIKKELDKGVKNAKEIINIIEKGSSSLVNNPKGFIPQNIENEDVLKVFELLRNHSNISKEKIRENAATNQSILCKPNNGILEYGSYVENQYEWEDVQFGPRKDCNMRYSGCGIIATYNALMALGENVSGQSMVELISGYEEDGAALNGEFGVSPVAISDYFKNNDYDVTMLTSRNKTEINTLGENSETVIVTAYNNQKDIMAQVHTVSITKDENDKYFVHNSYTLDNNNDYVSKGKDNNGNGFDTLQEAIDGMSSDAAAISVIGISQPKLGDFPETRKTMG